MKIEFEFTDGSCCQHLDVFDQDEAWGWVRAADAAGVEILSAWRDDEPWFGRCADMREGVA